MVNCTECGSERKKKSRRGVAARRTYRTVVSVSHRERVCVIARPDPILRIRKEHGLTPAQLAALLGISQQQVASFEAGRRRVPVSVLPTLASTLAVSVHDLVGSPTSMAKRGPTPKLQRQLERVSRLPKAKQKFVSEMLETVLQQAGS